MVDASIVSGELARHAVRKDVKFYLTFAEDEYHFYIVKQGHVIRYENFGADPIEAEIDFDAEIKS